MAIKVSGIKQVKSNLHKAINYITTDVTQKGLRAGLLQLGAFSTELTPVDTSNLVNSQYISMDKDVSYVRGAVGYTANYAEYVHDGPDRNWQKAGAQNFFLADAADRNMTSILRIIAAESKI